MGFHNELVTILALAGATIIDGRGGPPVSDGVVLIQDGRITAVGPRSAVSIPAGARVLDLRGRYLTPAFVNTNAHLTPYFGFEDFQGPDSLLVLEAVEGLRTAFGHGILTIRDTYGILPVLLAVRSRAAAGPEPLPRLLVAGNILGWGGPWSYSFAGSGGDRPANPFQQWVRGALVQEMGEELVQLTPDSLRARVRQYLARDPDFLKIGVTTHLARPSFLLFSPSALEAIVQEARRAGRRTDAHAESVEGLRMAVAAGVEVLQHPETAGGGLIPQDLLRDIASRGVVCAMMPDGITGTAWEEFADHLAMGGRMWPAEGPPSYMARLADSLRRAGVDPLSRPRTPSVQSFENRRTNAIGLIRAGCRVAIATDEVVGLPGKSNGRFGSAYPAALAGLVELGMTPMQAIVAATRNGAYAAGLEHELGTIEPGRHADLLVFGTSPLENIRNAARPEMIIRAGRVIPR